MSKEEETLKDVDERREPMEESSKDRPDEGEFKVTVRKLEVPVRPRGVLADG